VPIPVQTRNGSRPPTGELGVATAQPLPSWGLFGGNRAGAGVFVDDVEYVPELTWPVSVRETFPRMRHDSQLAALMRGTVLPITRYAWGIDDNGAPPALVDRICRDYNLPRIADAISMLETGRPVGPIGRARSRFSFAAHQELAFKALEYGHYFFEQAGDIGDDGLWHIRKLAPRPPRTITEITVAQDGGLVAITQQIGLEAKPIPVDRLVAYAWNADPGSWAGTSMYRDCYREWLLKDRLLRVDAVNHEKGGGVWWAEAAKDASPAELARLSALSGQINANQQGEIAVPAGTTMHLERPGGGPTTIESINRHDEAMSRPFFLMVIQLASTQYGSRGVGGTFADLMGQFQEGVAIWFRDVFNEHVLEDDVDWNEGADVEFVPRLAFWRPSDPRFAVSDIAELIKAGALRVDDELEEALREELGLPDRADASAAAAASRGGRQGRDKKAVRGAATVLPLPNRTLRRQPYEHEVRAQTDFAALERNYLNDVEALVAAWKTVRAGQVSELRGAIERANGDLAALAAIETPTAGEELVALALARAAAQGAAEALAEAKRQGVINAELPSLVDETTALEARAAAVAQLLARSLSEAGGRKAVQLTGGALAASAVADEVATYLDGLSDAYLVDQFGGAITAAQNAGRVAVIAAAGPASYYASELLDVNCCDPCRNEDGREFADLDEATRAYPTGGFKGCLGGPRCRGTVVAVYEEAAAAA
jgi:hypothetical protein